MSPLSWLAVLEAFRSFSDLLNRLVDFLLAAIRNPQSATEEFIGGKINDYFAQKALL